MITRLDASSDPAAELQAAGLDPNPWSAGPRAVFGAHSHPRAKRLFVVRGRIAFNDDELVAPAGIRIPAGFEHSAVVGDEGVDCVEAFE